MAVIEIDVFKRINFEGLVPPSNHQIFLCHQALSVCVCVCVCVRARARARARYHNTEIAGRKILN